MRDPELRRRLSRRSKRPIAALQIAQGIGGAIPALLVSYCNDQPELEKYIGKTVGQIAEEWGKTPVDTMLDLSIMGDLNVEFYRAQARFNSEYAAEMINNSPLLLPRRFRRRRAHQVLHRRLLHHRFPDLAGAR